MRYSFFFFRVLIGLFICQFPGLAFAQIECDPYTKKLERTLNKNADHVRNAFRDSLDGTQEINVTPILFFKWESSGKKVEESECVFELLSRENKILQTCIETDNQPISHGRDIFGCNELKLRELKDTANEEVLFLFLIAKKDGRIELSPLRIYAYCKSGLVYILPLYHATYEEKWTAITHREILDFRL
jgi:hypothetical protein